MSTRIKVIEISDGIVVKHGTLLQQSEAATLEFAYNHVDRNIVHVPKFYRYIESHRAADPRGYFAREYVHGQNLQDVNLDQHPDLPSRVADIVVHLGQIQGGLVPGPIGGGYPLGYI